MATDVFLTLVTEAQLGNKGLVVTVHDGAGILGHLMIGKASVVWFEKHAKKRGRKASWTDFHKWIMAKPEIPATRP
jgi:hypothetical protein